ISQERGQLEMCKLALWNRAGGCLPAGSHILRRLVNKVDSLLVRGYERCDFVAQRFVCAAGFGEKRCSLYWLALQRCVEEASDLLVPFRRHVSECDQAHDAATPWPDSSRASRCQTIPSTPLPFRRRSSRRSSGVRQPGSVWARIARVLRAHHLTQPTQPRARQRQRPLLRRKLGAPRPLVWPRGERGRNPPECVALPGP